MVVASVELSLHLVPLVDWSVGAKRRRRDAGLGKAAATAPAF